MCSYEYGQECRIQDFYLNTRLSVSELAFALMVLPYLMKAPNTKKDNPLYQYMVYTQVQNFYKHRLNGLSCRM